MMKQAHNLSRFIEAQNGTYEDTLEEIRNGKKTGHWMWFIFPQLAGLGFSETAKFYALQGIDEVEEYLSDSILKERLLKICNELLRLETNPVSIFGEIDSKKLKSSMTLFSLSKNTHPVFQKVLDKFYEGKKDEKTILLLSKEH